MTRSPCLLVAAATAVLCSPILAQGPDPRLLPADTTFVAHVQLGAVARLIDLEGILEQARDGKGPMGRDGRDATEILDVIQDQLGLDLLRDLHAVTVFSSDLERGEPTVMLTVSSRIDGVISRLKDAGVLSSERSGGIRFLRLSVGALAEMMGQRGGDDDDHGYLYVREVGDKRAILIGQSASDLVGAARVLEGDDESAEQGEGNLLKSRPGRDAIVYVELAGAFEKWTRRTPASEIGERVQRLSVEVGEDDGQVSLVVSAQTESEKDARNVAAVVNGLRGLLALTEGSDEIPAVAREALQDARAEARDGRVSVRLELSLDSIKQLIEDRGHGRRGRGKARRRDY